MNSSSANGLIAIPSARSVDEIVTRITAMLAARNVKLFTIIDHSGEAQKAGLTMPPTKVMIFGNPQAGTPLMLASPSTAIDLPLKLLIAEDAQGQVTVTYNSLEYLQQRHGLSEELPAKIAVLATLAQKAAE